MAPAKFDDLAKPAKDILTDDYQEKGTSFKAKAKTNFEGLGALTGAADGKSGATLTTAVDLDFKAAAGNATPAKLTWKFPKPLGVAGIAFDKLEIAKDGKAKLEASVDNTLHGVKDFKLECKSDLASMNSLALGVTYTGIADALVKVEIKALDPSDYSAELGYAVGGGATLSVKSSKASPVDVGVKYANGPLSCSGVAKSTFSAFTFHGAYKVNSDLNLAATYDHGGKTSGAFSAGVAFNAMPGTSVKGKLTGNATANSSMAGCMSVKHELAKGVSVTAGSRMPADTSKPWTCGFAFNVE